MTRNIIFISIIFIAAVLILIFYTLPQYQLLQERRAEIAAKESKAKELELIIKKTEQLKGQISERQKDIQLVDRILPSSSELPLFIASIERLAGNNGLILESFGITAVDSKDGQPRFDAFSVPKEFNTLPLQVTVSGNYNSFKNFLLDLEGSARLIDVDNISFSSSATEESAGQLTFSVSFKTFYK